MPDVLVITERVVLVWLGCSLVLVPLLLVLMMECRTRSRAEKGRAPRGAPDPLASKPPEPPQNRRQA